MTNTAATEAVDMTGRNEETTPDDVLNVFDDRDDRAEPLTAPEVADRLGVSRRTALNKLNDLDDDDDVASKQVGGRSKVFWLPIPADATDETSVDRAGRETPPAPADDRRDREPPADDGGGESTPTDDERDDTGDNGLEAILSSVDVPGSGEKERERRDAVRAAVGYLREHGEATPADLKRDVYPNYRAQYTDGQDPPRSWWKNCVYKALKEIAEQDARLEKADTTGEWTWRGGRGE